MTLNYPDVKKPHPPNTTVGKNKIIFDPRLNYSVLPAVETNSSSERKVTARPAFIKFPLEWVLTGNKFRSKPTLFVQHSNIFVPLVDSILSKLLEYVLVFDIELKESFVFFSCVDVFGFGHVLYLT